MSRTPDWLLEAEARLIVLRKRKSELIREFNELRHWIQERKGLDETSGSEVDSQS